MGNTVENVQPMEFLNENLGDAGLLKHVVINLRACKHNTIKPGSELWFRIENFNLEEQQ